MGQPESNGAELELELDDGCTWCERTSGIVLVIGAAGLLYIGLDLLTGGALSKLFVSGVTRAADAIDVPAEGHATGPGPAAEGVTGESAST